mmetsp:Transcript_11133/g.21541  ORF Transcript_11133/g.21541 Transcript_11133/m.21541 type:complete len:261 (-) Transcript_11133:20-802(-)
MTRRCTSSKWRFSDGSSSKRHVGQELLLATQAARQSSWNLCPHGIAFALDPTMRLSWHTTQRSSSTTVTTRSSSRASRLIAGRRSSSPSMSKTPLAAKSSFMVMGVAASLNRPLLCFLSSKSRFFCLCNWARSRASSSTSSMAASRQDAASCTPTWKSKAKKKSRPACQNLGFEKRVRKTVNAVLPASPSTSEVAVDICSACSQSCVNSRQAVIKDFFVRSSFCSTDTLSRTSGLLSASMNVSAAPRPQLRIGLKQVLGL